MGYNLTIGELHQYKEDGETYTTVKRIHHTEAPADGVPTDHTNERWPSYSGWDEFCKAVGFDINYLIPSHPGYRKITKEFQEEVDKIYDKELIPELRVRINWMKYWTDWAIKNCGNPVFHNS